MLDYDELPLAIDEEPVTFKDIKGQPEWVKAIEKNESINKNNMQKLVENPMGVKLIGLKWVFKVKKNAYGMINK